MSGCRGCGAGLTTTFLDLGQMPLANAFPRSMELAAEEPRFPLHALVCERCFLVQLAHDVSPDQIFSDYAYFSSYSDTWVEHARSFAVESRDRFNLGTDSRVVEVASNDGYLLRRFLELDVPVLGIEPAKNVADVAIGAGVPTEVRFFGAEVAADLRAEGIQADLLVGNNVVAHVPQLHDFVEGLRRMLSPGGVVSLEFPHLLRFLEGAQFDTIYHEHFSYLSLLALEPILESHDLRVFDVQELTTHGGSIRVLACTAADNRPEEERVAAVRDAERGAGLDDRAAYTSFAPRVERCRSSVRSFLDDQRAAGRSVVAYGAAAKGVTFLNYCGIGGNEIAYVVDRSPEKQGRFVPGTHIPILDPSEIRRTRPDFVLILPWNLRDEIIGQLDDVRSWGCRFVTAVPEVEVLP